ncbi:hypothetical protein ACOMHN_064796 [Nucella lapillus]
MLKCSLGFLSRYDDSYRGSDREYYYPGGHQSRCGYGFRDNGNGRCIDVDECTKGRVIQCGLNADCFNRRGSFDCLCRPGFKKTGHKTCLGQYNNTSRLFTGTGGTMIMTTTTPALTPSLTIPAITMDPTVADAATVTDTLTGMVTQLVMDTLTEMVTHRVTEVLTDRGITVGTPRARTPTPFPPLPPFHPALRPPPTPW